MTPLPHGLNRVKYPQETENLSKIVRGALCPPFCRRYQIVSIKDTCLLEIGHPFRRGTVHLSQFRQYVR